MRIARYRRGARVGVGLVLAQELVDLTSSLPDGAQDAVAMLVLDDAGRARVAERAQHDGERHDLTDVRLLAPIARPPKFLAIGRNYADHVRETGHDMPEVPMFFNKQSTCVVGPYDDVHKPAESDQLDYEGEMAFVIGRRCRRVPRERAHEVIAGFMVANDVSVRDWQMATPTFTMGKSWDTHGPIGPWVVTSDEVGDPHELDVRTWVNGQLRQESNTRELIFDCFAQVEHLTTAFTLEPGDVISTGSPAGVGVFMRPPQMLRPGDVVRVEVARLGSIENAIVEEPDTRTGY